MMIDAALNEEWELYDKIEEAISFRFNHLMQVEADLVFHGHFTRQDVKDMKPIEYRWHIGEINRRNKEKEEMLKKT